MSDCSDGDQVITGRMRTVLMLNPAQMAQMRMPDGKRVVIKVRIDGDQTILIPFKTKAALKLIGMIADFGQENVYLNVMGKFDRDSMTLKNAKFRVGPLPHLREAGKSMPEIAIMDSNIADLESKDTE